MDDIWGAVKLTLIVWGLAAFISFVVAGIIKLTFAAIQRKGGTKQARAAAAGKAHPEPAHNRPERSA